MFEHFFKFITGGWNPASRPADRSPKFPRFPLDFIKTK